MKNTILALILLTFSSFGNSLDNGHTLRPLQKEGASDKGSDSGGGGNEVARKLVSAKHEIIRYLLGKEASEIFGQADKQLEEWYEDKKEVLTKNLQKIRFKKSKQRFLLDQSISYKTWIRHLNPRLYEYVPFISSFRKIIKESITPELERFLAKWDKNQHEFLIVTWYLLSELSESHGLNEDRSWDFGLIVLKKIASRANNTKKRMVEDIVDLEVYEKTKDGPTSDQMATHLARFYFEDEQWSNDFDHSFIGRKFDIQKRQYIYPPYSLDMTPTHIAPFNETNTIDGFQLNHSEESLSPKLSFRKLLERFENTDDIYWSLHTFTNPKNQKSVKVHMSMAVPIKNFNIRKKPNRFKRSAHELQSVDIYDFQFDVPMVGEEGSKVSNSYKILKRMKSAVSNSWVESAGPPYYIDRYGLRPLYFYHRFSFFHSDYLDDFFTLVKKIMFFEGDEEQKRVNQKRYQEVLKRDYGSLGGRQIKFAFPGIQVTIVSNHNRRTDKGKLSKSERKLRRILFLNELANKDVLPQLACIRLHGTYIRSNVWGGRMYDNPYCLGLFNK